MISEEAQKCPCGSGLPYSECCHKFIEEKELPETAEKLMRSRYSAYAKSEIDYLIKTSHPENRHLYNPDSIREWADKSEWQKLEILRTKNGKIGDYEGQVEFKAYYREDGSDKIHHELSNFRKKEGKWYFYQGLSPSVETKQKTGRNEPCPCGSGKKYKKCCAKI